MTDFLNALVLLANFIVVPGLAYGSQLALGALGITLIYGILRFSHFAHGDAMALGTAVVILGTWGLQSFGIGLGALPTALLALPLGIFVLLVYLLTVDRAVYRYYRRIKVRPIVLVIASAGVMFVTNGLTRLLIGPSEQRFEDGARFLITAREFRAWTGLAEGFLLRTAQAITIIIALVAMAALFWFLAYTRAGKSMRAYADNEDLALLSGIDPERVVKVTWAIVAVLLVLAGTLYGLDKAFRPFTYFQLLLPFFAAAVVGGLGNPIGAVIGAYVVAFSELAITYDWQRFARYVLPEALAPTSGVSWQLLPTDYKFAVTFAILVLVLIFRPTGIFKGKAL